MALAVTAGALYVLLRAPVRFTRLREDEIDRTLELHAAIGQGTTPMMVAIGDKAVFFDRRSRLLPLSHDRSVSRRLLPIRSCAAPDDRDDVPRRAVRVRRRARSAAAVLPDLARLDSAAARSRLRVLQARRGGARAAATGDARRPAGKLYRQILRRGERDGAALPRARAVRGRRAAAGAARDLRRLARGEGTSASGSSRSASSTRRICARFPCAVVEEAAATDRDPGLRQPAARVRAARSCRSI